MNTTTTYHPAAEMTNGFTTIDSSTLDMNTSDMTDLTSPTPTMNHTTNHHTFIADADLSQLSLEIEKERHEYQERSRHLHEQLEAFRNEIDELKVDDNITNLDNLHREQQDQGNTKYSTIQKVKRGSTNSRVAFFEEL
jgi:merlin protein